MSTSEEVKIMPLYNAAVHYLELLTQKTWRSNICQECVIENYWDIKEYMEYSMTREVLGIERTLKIYKAKKTHFFHFHCELSSAMLQKTYLSCDEHRMMFYIMYDKDMPVWPGELTEREYGYFIEVPNELILHADNKNLHARKTLVIQFNYRHYAFTKLPIAQSGILTKDDEDALSSDMLSLYRNQNEKGEHTLISKEAECFSVHKLIANAHSDFFRCFFSGALQSVSLTCGQRTLDIALQYMYSGKVKDAPIEDLIEVYLFAKQYNIKPLRHSLFVLIREKNELKVDIAQRVQAALSSDPDELAAIAEEYILNEKSKEDKSEEVQRAHLLSKLRQNRDRRRY